MMLAAISHFNSEKLYTIFRQLTAKNKLYIAYSGGIDSLVLLHGFCQLRLIYPQLQLFAIHINHGLNSNADRWQAHCQKTCEMMDVPCIVRCVNVKRECGRQQSVEAVARHLRYIAFGEIISCDSVLLTAHHADDQAETLLLQLLRGAGPKGLAAIPLTSRFAHSKELLRPLLQFSREDILAYANEHNLRWVEDDSNLDLSIERNYVRQKIIPLLKQRWTAVLPVLGRVANNCYEVNYAAEILAAQDCAQAKGSNENTLSVNALSKLDAIRQRNVLRYFIQQQGLPLPSRCKIEHIQTDVINCANDAEPLIEWTGASVRRYRDDLYVFPPLPAHDSHIELFWDLRLPLTLPNKLGTLKAIYVEGSKVDSVPANLTVRFRRGGECCQPIGKKHHCILAKLMQAWRIPPWQRNRIPLIYCGSDLMVVVGYCQCVGWNQAVNIVVS